MLCGGILFRGSRLLFRRSRLVFCGCGLLFRRSRLLFRGSGLHISNGWLLGHGGLLCEGIFVRGIRFLFRGSRFRSIRGVGFLTLRGSGLLVRGLLPFDELFALKRENDFPGNGQTDRHAAPGRRLYRHCGFCRGGRWIDRASCLGERYAAHCREKDTA
ncbi:MAG: hypothetical protein WBF73_13900 [Bradyrhizobium sp.]